MKTSMTPCAGRSLMAPWLALALALLGAAGGESQAAEDGERGGPRCAHSGVAAKRRVAAARPGPVGATQHDAEGQIAAGVADGSRGLSAVSAAGRVLFRAIRSSETVPRSDAQKMEQLTRVKRLRDGLGELSMRGSRATFGEIWGQLGLRYADVEFADTDGSDHALAGAIEARRAAAVDPVLMASVLRLGAKASFDALPDRGRIVAVVARDRAPRGGIDTGAYLVAVPVADPGSSSGPRSVAILEQRSGKGHGGFAATDAVVPSNSALLDEIAYVVYAQ